MLDTLRKLIVTDDGADQDDGEGRLRVATAALLVEMSRADFEQTRDEDRAMARLLASRFALTNEEAAALLSEAQKSVDDAVSLHDFTRALHNALDETEKIEVIRMLWQVALADGELDRYEDYLVRKVADLMYVSPGDVIRVRNEVRDRIDRISSAGR